MARYSFTVSDMNALRQRLVRAIRIGIINGGGQIAQEVRRRFRKAPGPVHYPIQWKSLRQKRWYFWARNELIYQEAQRVVFNRRLKNKAPNNPFAPRMRKAYRIRYTRRRDPWSADLRFSWHVEKRGPLSWAVGTPVAYAPYVHGQNDQQPFHRNTGWPTDLGVAQEVARSQVARLVARAIGRAL